MEKSDNNTLISIVIPTFNRAYCLPQAIDSVLRQSHQNFEIIIADDGSTDDTESMIRQRYASDPRIRYFRQENRGVSAARNFGIAQATGSYVALLDSDDIWKPWKLELQLVALRHFPQAGMIWTDMEAINAQDQMVAPRYLRMMYSAWQWFKLHELFSESLPLTALPVTLPVGIKDEKLYMGDISSPMIMGNMVHTSTVLIKRERLKQVGEFNESLLYSGEDYDFHLRTCRAGPVAFADLPSIQYRVGMPDRLTRPELNIYIARNFINTILPIIANERQTIQLPNRMIHLVLADAYAWLGEQELKNGQHYSATRHLFLSLRYRPWQLRIGALAIMSLFPANVSEFLLDLYHFIQGFFI